MAERGACVGAAAMLRAAENSSFAVPKSREKVAYRKENTVVNPKQSLNKIIRESVERA